MLRSDPDRKLFLAFVRSAQRTGGLRQRDIARRAGITQPQLSRLLGSAAGIGASDDTVRALAQGAMELLRGPTGRDRLDAVLREVDEVGFESARLSLADGPPRDGAPLFRAGGDDGIYRSDEAERLMKIAEGSAYLTAERRLDHALEAAEMHQRGGDVGKASRALNVADRLSRSRAGVDDPRARRLR